jgi:hypothetical protein
MPEDKKKTTIKIGSATVQVNRVEIVNRRVEEPNEYELEYGTVIRVSNPTMVVYRIEGQRDWEGNPSFYVKNATATIVVTGPNQKKPTNGGSA